VIDFVCEQCGQFVSRSVASIHHGPDRLVRFVYFYQFFDGGGRRVHVDILPSGVVWD